MNYIYTNTRDGRRYILNPEIHMGEKVCLVSMSSCEDKFVSPKTLKRWYSKNTVSGIVVRVEAFTGMKIGLFRVDGADCNGNYITWTKKDKCLLFDPETGKQTNAKNPKFANKIGCSYCFTETSLEWAIS